MDSIKIQYYKSPCGEIILASVGNDLCLCDWNEMPCADRNLRRLRRYIGADFSEKPTPVLQQAAEQLDEYFAGERTSFSIPLLTIGTAFQKSVWQALLEIPFGSTRSYMDIARRVGNPRGVRAVAQAVGANGISIFIPCHRVIGSDGSLTGFAGGLGAKKILLDTERRVLNRTDDLGLLK